MTVTGDNYTLYPGDVLDILPTLPDESYAACLCDPPYGLGETPDITEVLTHWLAGDDYKARGGGFMGRSWDSFVPGPSVWKEVYRVLKPGGILFAFGGTRTADILSIAIRLAGFERFDEIQYVYGSGFPKSAAIDKMIDREAGGSGQYGNYKSPDHAIKRKPGDERMHDGYQRPWRDNPEIEDRNSRQYIPATDAARTWSGYGTSFKPAHEPILCFRKPRRATYAQTAVEHGSGALWVDGCRVGAEGGGTQCANRDENGKCNGHPGRKGTALGVTYHASETTTTQGRWPANLILDDSDEVAALFPVTTSGKPNGAKRNANGPFLAHANGVDLTGYGDTGSAARFFMQLPALVYAAKAATSERNEGLDGATAHQRDPSRNASQPSMNGGEGNPYNRGAKPVVNSHPTVKPVALTEYLARLLVPPVEYRQKARILIPFAGSGSEMIGALLAGWLNVDGIELEPEYVEIAATRLAHWHEERVSTEPRKIEGATSDYADCPLFAEAVA